MNIKSQNALLDLTHAPKPYTFSLESNPKMSTINIPPSPTTVQVSIIDTTLDANIPTAPFMGPPVAGFENFQVIDYAFLVTHRDPVTGKERRILFDLGCPKNPEKDLPPSTNEIIKGFGGYVKIEKNVSEILTEGGIELGSVEAIVWRYVVSRDCS